MKNISVSVLLFLIILSSCKEKESVGYKISGKVNNPQKDGYVFLEEFDDQTLKKVDSVRIKDDGTYLIEGKIKEPGFYRVNFFNKQQVVLVLENAAVEVNADGSNPSGFSEVKGSKATDDFISINKIVEEFQEKSQEIQQRVMAGGVIDTPRVQKEFEDLKIEYVGKIKGAIQKIGPTVTAMFATNYLDKDEEFKFFDSLATVFEKEMPDSKYSKQFVENVEKIRKVSIGKAAPDISLTNPSGQTVSLKSLRGKYVLIDFWASWCGPCRQENPNVVKLYNRFKNKNFEIFGVSLDNDKFKWVQAIEKDGLTWEHVSDLKGWGSEAAVRYNVSAIPATYLIDKDGKIIAKNLRGKDLEKKLEDELM